MVWVWPFASTLSNGSGLRFEVNGFEGMRQLRHCFRSLSIDGNIDEWTAWPPPDPDRITRAFSDSYVQNTSAFLDEHKTDVERLKAFRARQRSDLSHAQDARVTSRRRHFHERFSPQGQMRESSASLGIHEDGEESWRNSEGERLRDFGLDEDAEFYDEDSVPLAHLLEQKRKKKHR